MRLERSAASDSGGTVDRGGCGLPRGFAKLLDVRRLRAPGNGGVEAVVRGREGRPFDLFEAIPRGLSAVLFVAILWFTLSRGLTTWR